MSEEQQHRPEAHSDLDNVPEDVSFPFRVEMLGEQWVILQPDPAELFQHQNRAKISNDNIDAEQLYSNLWRDFVRPADRPDANKPDLCNLKGSDEKNQAFTFMLGFMAKHFLGGGV